MASKVMKTVLQQKIVAPIVLLSLCLLALPCAAAEWRDRVRDFASANFRHPAWGYSHSGRDYMLSSQLAAADHVDVDDDVLFAAAYLHDMAAFKPWEVEEKEHGDVGAMTIDAVLAGTDFPMEKIEAVRAAIRSHMYYRRPVGPEAIYLHDADALDWLGAIGIARVLALTDPSGGKPFTSDSISLIEKNMKDVPSHIVSPAARHLIASRLAEESDFLKALSGETDGLRLL